MLFAEQVGDLLVRNIARLVVVLDDITALIAYAAVAGLREGITSLVLCANIAVDSGPSFVALAFPAVSHRSIFPPSQGAADWKGLSVARQGSSSPDEGGSRIGTYVARGSRPDQSRPDSRTSHYTHCSLRTGYMYEREGGS
jgi:hypothetical protein